MPLTEEYQFQQQFKGKKKSPYGHKLSARTGQIDLLLYKGEDGYYDIIKKIGCTSTYLSSHLRKLERMGHKVKHKKDSKLVLQTVTTVRKPKKKELVMTEEVVKGKRGSQAESMNACLEEGMTLEQIVASTGLAKGRVKGHISHLRKKMGMSVTETEGVFKIE
jgi:DNA-binding MarR family transcriptional regulator